MEQWVTVVTVCLVLTTVCRVTDGLLMENNGSMDAVPCGMPVIQPHVMRIIGGSPAMPGSWPWMVMLGLNGYQKCGGSILNKKFVLSSAHCFDNLADVDQWTAHVGKHHVTQVDPPESTHTVERLLVHPGYNNLTLQHDLVLIRLREHIEYSDYVRPICVPPSKDKVASVGQMCYTTGWGSTRGTGDRSVLNQVGLPLLSNYWCSRPDWYGSRFDSANTFCAGYPAGGKDACAGDSGGPYNCRNNGKWYVQGVTSWGYDCAQPHWPGIYTDVSKYGAWIRSTLAAEGYPLTQ